MMLIRLDAVSLRSCLRCLGAQPAGTRNEMRWKLMGMYASHNKELRAATFAVVSDAFRLMPLDVCRTLATQFDNSLVPLHFLWPSTHAMPTPETKTETKLEPV